MRLLHLALGGCLKAPPVSFGLTEDTGGHITYILGLAAALQDAEGVEAVEVVTRRFEDDALGPAYAQAHERLGPKAHITRLTTRRTGYLDKEDLANELESFTEALLRHVEAMDRKPDVIHAHFADAGRAALSLKRQFGIPVVFTAHSLGQDKRAAFGDDACPDLDARIAQEGAVIRAADAIVASSRDETERQVMRYEGARAERVHCIAPGVTMLAEPSPEASVRALLAPFLRHPDRPMILAVARPVAKKNLAGLVDIYGTTPGLREAANLVVLAGLRDDVSAGPAEPRGVFADIAARIDRHDLYGHVALPKRHAPGDVPALYRLAARTGGVFVNPALNEPFGLTILEAATHGLPVVATCHGGPRDTIAEIGHGFVADPLDHAAFGGTIAELLAERETWALASRNGLARTREDRWKAYVARYVDICRTLVGRSAARRSPILGSRPPLLACDIDNTLTGCRDGARRFAAWAERQARYRFAVATGRSLQEAERVLREWGLPSPELIVSSVGTEIYWRGPSGRLRADEGFARHIAQGWDADAVDAAVAKVPGLRLQDPVEQRAYKRSYTVCDLGTVDAVRIALRTAGVEVRLVHSHGTLLDILPARAGKGAALRWCAAALGLPLSACVAAGDSGNDVDMLEIAGRAIVVANGAGELRAFLERGLGHVHLSRRPHADGVLDGLARLGEGRTAAAQDRDAA